MPGGDRTGPYGLGPRTGRARGYCAGFQVPGFMNPMPGLGWGFGRGGGRGRGFRRGCWYYPPVNPYPQTEDELTTLEDYKKRLETEKSSIEQEISNLENQMKKLKAKPE